MLRFQWEQIDGPPADLIDSDQREAFFIPVQTGEYLFRFRAEYPKTEVNKKSKVSEWDNTKVIVRSIVCGPPTAETGDDQTLAVASGSTATVTLDGGRSHPVRQAACENLAIDRYSWRVSAQPPGSNVAINNADQETATVNLSVVGEYRFQLEIQDTGGTTGRADTDSCVTTVTLLQSPVCDASLDVTVINARNGLPIEGADVTVVDADGTSHTMDTDAGGVASLDGLAPGIRQSITVESDEMVPALHGTGAVERVRFERTTVLDHCADVITIPLRLTESGRAASNNGTVFAKVPTSVFNMLPHSWRCAGECRDDSDCDETYYCEQEDHRCRDLCTPRSVLPFFSLGDNNISGQFNFVMLVPVSPLSGIGQFDSSIIFTPPSGVEAHWPGNLATNDTFLNGLSTTLGLNCWGDECIRTSDCPNPDGYVCEQNPAGEYRCKDKSPLRNVEMALPAGQDVRLALIAGIMDLSTMEFMQSLVISICIWSCDPVEFDKDKRTALLSAMRTQTLHVCLLEVDVVPGKETDISAAMEELTADDCWNIDYQQKDSVVALKDSISTGAESCTSDEDCCDYKGNCGWPVSGERCLPDPENSTSKKCFTPMFRVRVFTDEEIEVKTSATGFHPESDRADDRLYSWLPDTASYEEVCDTGTLGFYKSCDPPRIHNIPVPDDTECSYPYSLSLMTLEFPVGHVSLPDGGRIPIGFDFNRTPDHYHEPTFLVPSLKSTGLSGTNVTAYQVFLRNKRSTIDGRNFPVPGKLGVSRTSMSNVGSMYLPGFFQQPTVDPLPDAGLDVKVFFEAENPTVWPDPIFERVYAMADGLGDPRPGINDLPGVLTLSGLADGEIIGLVVNRVDRGEVWIDEEEREKKEVFLVDPTWRIYAPKGTTSIILPQMSTGDKVWITTWVSSSTGGPLDYDLFLTDQILGRQAAYAEDSYALIAP
jgi:hypothetical protein